MSSIFTTSGFTPRPRWPASFRPMLYERQSAWPSFIKTIRCLCLLWKVLHPPNSIALSQLWGYAHHSYATCPKSFSEESSSGMFSGKTLENPHHLVEILWVLSQVYKSSTWFLLLWFLLRVYFWNVNPLVGQLPDPTHICCLTALTWILSTHLVVIVVELLRCCGILFNFRQS